MEIIWTDIFSKAIQKHAISFEVLGVQFKSMLWWLLKIMI